MDGAARRQHPRIGREEPGRREALARPLGPELRIGEGDPDLVHLARGEKRTDQLDARTQKTHVAHAALGRGLRTAPHAGALDVDADEVALRRALGQRHRILALAAPQFEHDGTVVMKKIAVPAPLERMIPAEHLVEPGLHQTFECQVLGEPAQFVLSHIYVSLIRSSARCFGPGRTCTAGLHGRFRTGKSPTASIPRTVRCGTTVKT